MKLKVELKWELKGLWGVTIVMVVVLHNPSLPAWLGVA